MYVKERRMKGSGNFLKVEELMELAIQFEHDSMQYYHDLRNMVSDHRAQGLLDTLEHQEREHRDLLRNYDLGDKPYPLLQYGPSFDLTMPKVEQEDPNLDELLEVAIEREIVSKQVYETTAGQVFGNLAELLNDLAGFEEEHERKLKDLRSFLKGEDRI
jgi:rubrerythrin